MLGRDGKARGETTGKLKCCNIEGCRGEMFQVLWTAPVERTWCCSMDIQVRKGVIRLVD